MEFLDVMSAVLLYKSETLFIRLQPMAIARHISSLLYFIDPPWDRGASCQEVLTFYRQSRRRQTLGALQEVATDISRQQS